MKKVLDLKLTLDIKQFFVDNLLKEKFMTEAYLEHTNITVENPDALASLLCTVFGWTVRWRGGAKNDGYTVHVGNNKDYLALYRPKVIKDIESDYETLANINHIGIVVPDLTEVEKRVLSLKFDTYSHGDYEPGRRFYFMAQRNIEIEVVSYL